MTRGGHSGRKTSRIVRMPATKFGKIQKRLGKKPAAHVTVRKGRKPV